jgi:hypothetical protein
MGYDYLLGISVGEEIRPPRGFGFVRNISHASTLTFMEMDGTCIDGPIAKADAATVVVQPYGKPPVTIPRPDLLQISQGDALILRGQFVGECRYQLI